MNLKTDFWTIHRALLSGLTATLLLLIPAWGCAPMTAALKDAQTNYRQARQDREVVAHAPIELHEAALTLQQAEETWQATADPEVANQLAQDVNQKIEIARTTARKNIAQAEAQRLERERQIALLEAHIRKTEEAREEAERAQKNAEARAREAEEAYDQLRKSALEIDRARQVEATRARDAQLARQQAEREADGAMLRAQRLEQQLAELRTILSGFLSAASRVK